jgi:N-acetylglucosamine-6-sulfatase
VGALGRTGLALIVALGAILAVAVLHGPGDAGAQPDAGRQRPNVVVLLSDDQTVDEMRFMPEVRRLIGRAGAKFDADMTNWPLCCPSRATMLSGEYAHNHGVLGNRAPLGGFDRFDTAHDLPVWLHKAGYYTAHIGKLMNGYESSPVGVPPGWSEWHGSKRTYWYYGVQLLEADGLHTYGSIHENTDDPASPDRYNTTVFTDKAVDIIRQRAPSDRPFYLSVSYLAPHGGGPNRPDTDQPARCDATAKAPVEHLGDLESTPLPRPPSFDEADVSDKPAAIADRDPLSAKQIANATRNYRCRGESVMGIDDGAKRVVDALRATGELKNTLLIYTSDNGFFHGEHRIPSGKNQVYEEAVRVPLLIRGPGIPRRTEVGDITINADLVPTILDATGARADLPQDGRSLLPFIAHPDRFHGRELLLEQRSRDGDDGEPRGTEYSAIRTDRYKLVDNATGETELYDLEHDPYELRNVHGDAAYAEAETALTERLAALRTCAGRSCRTSPAITARLPGKVSRHGRRCTPAGGFIYRVRNRARSRLVGVDFTVDGRNAGSTDSAPFDRHIAGRLLRRERRPLIEASAELVDGRVLTLHDRPRIC